jgi:hypothetical protein
MNKEIIATVFGGEHDEQTGAYMTDGKFIHPHDLGVALPYRFMAEQRPNVRVHYKGKVVDCKIIDVGPWNTHDPYWIKNRRPQAEFGTDMRGRHTNGAGIDLTPGAADALGFPGLGRVDWEFIS